MEEHTYNITFKNLCLCRAKRPDTNGNKTSSPGDPALQTSSAAVSSETESRTTSKWLAQMGQPQSLFQSGLPLSPALSYPIETGQQITQPALPGLGQCKDYNVPIPKRWDGWFLVIWWVMNVCPCLGELVTSCWWLWLGNKVKEVRIKDIFLLLPLSFFLSCLVLGEEEGRG